METPIITTTFQANQAGPHKFSAVVTNDMKRGCLACEYCGQTKPLPLELLPDKLV